MSVPGTSRKSVKNADVSVAEVAGAEPGLVTVTSKSDPGERGGVVPVTRVGSGTVPSVTGRPPIEKLAPPRKPPPRTYTVAPPEAGPDPGWIALTAKLAVVNR